MFKTLTSKPLWVNVIAAIVLLLLLLFLFLASLALLTRHGKSMRIPSVTGMSYAEAKKTLETQGFEVQIQDSSSYADTLPPLQVLKQFPESDELVKVNRTIYLSINRAEAPITTMPNVVSMSFRTALATLKQAGLKLEDTVFKPDFARNSVLQQMYKGENIAPGTKIQQGNAITLVLGSGVGGAPFPVPPLFGLTYQEAKASLDALGLTLGAVVPDPGVRGDTANLFVYRQRPDQYDDEHRLNSIHPGQTVDIFLGVREKVDSIAAIRNNQPPAGPPPQSPPQPNQY